MTPDAAPRPLRPDIAMTGMCMDFCVAASTYWRTGDAKYALEAFELMEFLRRWLPADDPRRESVWAIAREML